MNATHQHHHWRIGCLAAEVNPVDRKVNVFQRNPRERLHSNLSRRFRQHTLKTNHLRQKGSQQMALAAIPTGLFGRNSRMGGQFAQLGHGALPFQTTLQTTAELLQFVDTGAQNTGKHVHFLVTFYMNGL